MQFAARYKRFCNVGVGIGVVAVTMPQFGDPGIDFRQGQSCSLLQIIQTIPEVHQTSYSLDMKYRSLCYSGPCMKLTTHIHLVPGLRMSGVMPPLPPYAFMVWTGTTSHIPFNVVVCVQRLAFRIVRVGRIFNVSRTVKNATFKHFILE